MKRIILILIITQIMFSSWVFTQNKFSMRGTLGLGFARHNYGTELGGLSGNYGIAFRYHCFAVKYKRIVSSELSVIGPAGEVKSHEFLMGYLSDLKPQSDNFNLYLGIYTGIGSIEKRLPNTIGFLEYETVSRFGTCLPLELELEYWPFRSSGFPLGLSLSIFSTISQFSPVYGTHLNIFLEY